MCTFCCDKASSHGSVCAAKTQFAKVESLVSKSNLTEGDVKGTIAGLEFVLKSGCKYDVDDETLSLELNQLGLPREHCEALAKVYSGKKAEMQEHLRAQTLALARLDGPLEWRVDYVLASHANKAVNAPVASLKLHMREPDNGNKRSVAFEASHEELRVLLQELTEAKSIIDAASD